MIHYHGLPITPGSAAAKAITGAHAFVSFQHPEQLSIAIQLAQSFAVDCGAFSAWKSGKPITDWTPYYQWVSSLCRYPGFDFAVIPDVIDGSESDNDALVKEWPEQFKEFGAPVWHLHESLNRLSSLSITWRRVCLGSSGKYADPRSQEWRDRMGEAMDTVCGEDGLPRCKLHGLRMLSVKIYPYYPFASADSTNIGRNIGIDSRWTGAYMPASKEGRAYILRERIESQQGAVFWKRSIKNEG